MSAANYNNNINQAYITPVYKGPRAQSQSMLQHLSKLLGAQKGTLVWIELILGPYNCYIDCFVTCSSVCRTSFYLQK